MFTQLRFKQTSTLLNVLISSFLKGSAMQTEVESLISISSAIGKSKVIFNVNFFTFLVSKH